MMSFFCFLELKFVKKEDYIGNQPRLIQDHLYVLELQSNLKLCLNQ